MIFEKDLGFEDEMKTAVEELSYYQGNNERRTLDGEWTESELKDDLWDEANKYINGTKDKTGWLEKNKNKAVKDPDLCKVQYLVEDICSRFDMIEIYNKVVDLHRNDKPRKFGIVYFDDIAIKEIAKTLNDNLVSK